MSYVSLLQANINIRLFGRPPSRVIRRVVFPVCGVMSGSFVRTKTGKPFPGIQTVHSLVENKLNCSRARRLYFTNHRASARKVRSPPRIYLTLFRDQPFSRISASFNINNYILSRPYPSIPFLTSSLSPSAAPQSTLAHLLSLEVSHRISQLDSLGFIPSRVRRLLGGERVPAEIVVIPRLRWKDLLILGRYLLGLPGPPVNTPWVAPPTENEGYFDSALPPQDLRLGAGWEEWIFRGEQGVWEVGSYIRAKCAVEITLDHRTATTF